MQEGKGWETEFRDVTELAARESHACASPTVCGEALTYTHVSTGEARSTPATGDAALKHGCTREEIVPYLATHLEAPHSEARLPPAESPELSRRHGSSAGGEQGAESHQIRRLLRRKGDCPWAGAG